MHILRFIILSLLLSVPIFGKVRILTFHYNQPDFIEFQQRCLQRFLVDEWELIVFNDAATLENERAIQNTCDRLGIQCIRFEPQWHLSDPLNDQIWEWLHDPTIYDWSLLSRIRSEYPMHPSVRHSHVIQYALDHFAYDHDDAVVLMDADAFFIRQISIKQRLQRWDIFGMTREIKEKKSHYLWVPFVAFNPAQLPNIRTLRFNPAVIDHKLHDTGAQSFHYLAANPSVKCKKTLPAMSRRLARLSDSELKEAGYTKKEISLIRSIPKHKSVEFNLENCVLHFREVSFELPGHETKADCLREFMEKILNAKG